MSGRDDPPDPSSAPAPWSADALDPDADATLDVLRSRLQEAEQAMRALTTEEADSTRPPLDPQLFAPAHRSLDLVSASYRRLGDERNAVFDALPAQMAVLDADGFIVAVNRSWRRFADHHGLDDPAHGVGLNYLTVCRAADPQQAPEAAEAERGLSAVIDGRRPAFALQYRCPAPDQVRWFRMLANPLPEAGGAVVLHLEISELKLIQEALEQSEQRWRLLVETLPDALLVVRAGVVVLANQAATALLGPASAPRLLGRRWNDLLHAGDRRTGNDLLNLVDVQRLSATVELRLLRHDGSAVETEVAAGPIHMQDEAAALLIARDLRDRKRAQRELERLNQQLAQAQKLEAVGRLAGGVAHDFNNLLTAINGFGSLLRRQLPEDGPLRSFADEICKAGDRAAALTGQLLAFGRRQITHPTALDLNAKVRELERLLRRLVGEDLGLTSDLRAEPPFVWADPGQVEQLLVNLVVNARDAMPDGGRVEIATDNAELPERRRRPRGDGGRRGDAVVLQVRDWGLGMDEEVLSHIFEPFFTTKEEGRGTGLGLATVYGIVTQAGGHVEVSSTPGAGSTFRVYLPTAKAPEEDAPRHPPDDAVTTGSRPATVLVVEDEEAVRRFVCQVLRPAGHRLLEAADGVEAQRLARRTRNLDLLLCDLVLPGIDGREVAARVREYHPNARILFMSGYSEEELAVRQHQRPEDLLEKPFTAGELVARLGRALRLPAGAAG